MKSEDCCKVTDLNESFKTMGCRPKADLFDCYLPGRRDIGDIIIFTPFYEAESFKYGIENLKQRLSKFYDNPKQSLIISDKVDSEFVCTSRGMEEVMVIAVIILLPDIDVKSCKELNVILGEMFCKLRSSQE